MPTTRRTTVFVFLVIALSAAAGCTTAGPDPDEPSTAPTVEPSAPLPTARALGEDLRSIVDFVRRTHPDPWHDITRERFDGAVSALDERLGEGLSADAFMVEVMRLLALLGPGDGHTGVFALEQDVRLLPLRLYRFDDGLFVVDAADDLSGVIGARVRTIGGRSADEVWAATVPLVPADNEMTALARVPQYMVVSNVLHGLGVVEDATMAVEVGVTTGEGERSVAVTPVPAEDYVDAFDVWHPMIPPALPARDGAISYEHAGDVRYTEVLADERVLYVGYHVTLGSTDDLADAVLDSTHRVDHVVLDLRFNPGGDNTTYGPLLEALRHPAIDRPGAVIALVGRSTFSAAGNLATELDASTSAVFVGERTGFRPDQFGDPASFVAPNTGLRVEAATRALDLDGRGPHRPWIEPDVRVAIRSVDYFGGTDPVLDAALGLVLEG